MAHEISHLLLGRGSHVGGGLMKDHWNHLDIQQVASMRLEFSESQADHIRRTIETTALDDHNARARRGCESDGSVSRATPGRFRSRARTLAAFGRVQATTAALVRRGGRGGRLDGFRVGLFGQHCR